MTPDTILPEQHEYEYFVTDWRLSKPALLAIAELVLRRRPRTILETGPGLSSLLFFRYQQILMDEVEYTILDEQGPWHNRFREVAKAFIQNNPRLHLVAAKLTEERYYDISQLPSYPSRYDLISLDGPGSSDARSSPTALRLLTEHIGGSTCLVVDDTHRAGEQKLVDWLQEFHNKRYGVNYDVQVVQDDLFPRTTTILTPPAL